MATADEKANVTSDVNGFHTFSNLEDGIREGLTEMLRAQRTGKQLRPAEELINEL